MSRDLNRVTLIGRITKDCNGEVDPYSFGWTQSGVCRANISVAVNNQRKNATTGEWEDDASFFDVQVWGQMAESLAKYFVKGKQICIDGHLRQDTWEKDGVKKHKVIIIADNIQLLQDKKGDGFTPANPNSVGQTATKTESEKPAFTPKPEVATRTETTDGFQEDIPF